MGIVAKIAKLLERFVWAQALSKVVFPIVVVVLAPLAGWVLGRIRQDVQLRELDYINEQKEYLLLRKVRDLPRRYGLIGLGVGLAAGVVIFFLGGLP